MRSTTVVAMSALDGSVNQASATIPTSQIVWISAAVTVASSSTGTLKLQFSNDIPNPVVTGWVPAAGSWIDITSASSVVSGAGTTGIQKTEICAAWIRAVWTKNNGSAGTVSVNIQIAGG